LGCFDGTVLFDTLVDWVEDGTEPTTYTEAGVNPDGDPRTRPMCPFPQVAVYSGSGSIDDAANFTCEDQTAQADGDTAGSGGGSGCFISSVQSGFAEQSLRRTKRGAQACNIFPRVHNTRLAKSILANLKVKIILQFRP
jgi:hypothetical protein